MKLAKQIIEDIEGMTEDVILEAFKAKLDDFGFENITVDSVSSDANGDNVVTFSDDENQEIDVLFTYDEDDGALAIILDPDVDLEDDEDDELDIVELDSVDPLLITFEDGSQTIDLVNLSWLSENTLQAILTVGDLIDTQADAEEEVSERTVSVIRGGKKVRLPLVRRRRKKRMTAKQRRAIRKAVRTRRTKKAVIQRKRKRSLALRRRSGLKRNKNKKLKVKGAGQYL